MLENQFAKFVATYNGKSVEANDPTNKFQCYDLAYAWLEAIGIPKSAINGHLYAYEIFTKPTSETLKYFDLIKNGLFNAPETGDLVVTGTRVGTAGHISIAAEKGKLMTYLSFDQNWDTAHYNLGKDPKTGLLIPYSRLVTHYYDLRSGGTLGWLRPKDLYLSKIEAIKSILATSVDSLTKLKKIKQEVSNV